MKKDDLKNRFIALYVENQVGVLAKVAGLFSGKSYNLQSLTVGRTEHEDISRMTICVSSDDVTFEQIKKQLNTMVEVIKVVDLTDMKVQMKELLFAKIKSISMEEKAEVFRIAETYGGGASSSGGYCKPVDIGVDSVILESVLPEEQNNDLCALLRATFRRIDIVRGGSVAIESTGTAGK